MRSFYLVTNVLTLLELFVVGRLFRWVSQWRFAAAAADRAARLLGLVAFAPIALLRIVKICEYGGNYSILNTASASCFLPLSTKGKYEGKIATDTFFWRFGDLIPAVIVYVGLHWLDFTAQQFAVVNMGLSLVWLATAVNRAVQSRRTAHGTRPSFVRGAATALAYVRNFAPRLATRAVSWLAAAVGVAALASGAG